MSDEGAAPRAGQGTGCHLCPVCAAIGTLRQARPEVVEHLVRAGAELLAAVRALVEAAPAPAGRQADQGARERREGGIQRIHVE